MNIKEYLRSQSFHGVIVGLGIVIIALIIFQAGVFVGYRKASFACRSGDNYYRMFDRRTPSPFGFPLGDKFSAPHGAAGEVVGISLPTLVVSDRDDSAEQTVLVGTSTVVRKFDADIAVTDIKAGDFIVAIGDPNGDSQIVARLIRILPEPPMGWVPMMR